MKKLKKIQNFRLSIFDFFPPSDFFLISNFGFEFSLDPPLDSRPPPRFNTAALVGRKTRACGSPRLSVDTFDP